VTSDTFGAEMSGDMRRYRFLFCPKWIAFHVVVVVAVITMVNLGFWQLRRLDERRDFNAEVVARSDRPAVPIGELLDEPGFTPENASWRRVTASGTWLPQQVVVFNRTQNGVAGDNIVTALVQDDGSTVLVNRGFVPLGDPPPAPPTADVEIVGTVRPSQQRRTGELSDSDLAITEVRRIDIEQLAPQYPGDVVPVYLDLVGSTPEVSTSDPQPVPPPELGEANHLSYAGQWFIFSIAVVVGWLFAVRRSVRMRRAAASADATIRAAAAEPAPPDSHRQDDDAEATTTP
jgi:surfeit locus 1 family protein